MPDERAATYTLTSFDRGRALRMPSLRASVTLPDRSVVGATLGMHPLVVGTSPDCDLVLPDPMVSRKHCMLRISERGVVLRDLGSKNGTVFHGASIVELILPPSVPVTVGGSTLVVLPSGEPSILPLSAETSFGEAIGHSLPMRALFAKLERAAKSDETILLLGESGTGKEVLARAIHENSPRKDKPFVVVDCGAITPSLVEAELFGYMRGAFTGAAANQAGLLEQSNGGTLFIDELGELPLELQPKLLRALEAKQVRRLGSSEWRPFDARVVAATHRNLRAKVAEGSFREDLYYRIAVVEVQVPSLRERKDDIPLLVERFLARRDPPCSLADLPPETISQLTAYDWPGNVRELRNAVARLILFPELLKELGGPRAKPASESPKAEEQPDEARIGRLLGLTLPEARELVLEELERSYVAAKLRQHGGNVSRAAEAMGVSRQHVHRLIERHKLREK